MLKVAEAIDNVKWGLMYLFVFDRIYLCTYLVLAFSLWVDFSEIKIMKVNSICLWLTISGALFLLVDPSALNFRQSEELPLTLLIVCLVSDEFFFLASLTFYLRCLHAG